MILCIINILLFLFLIFKIFKYNYLIKREKEINKEVDNENKNLELYNKELKKHNKILITQRDLFLIEKNKSKELKKTYQEELNNIIEQINTSQSNAESAFENYCDILDKSYKHKELEYINLKEKLKEEYLDIQKDIFNELNQEQQELNKIKQTRIAALEARKREQELKEKSSFYCLKLTEQEINDIQKLENIKPMFNQPRALSMLIWTSYIRSAATTLCNNVLNGKNITGIYKITNLLDDSCYIGQAVNIGDRWKEHLKAGLGIDTPANNKLYKAMQKDKVWNFSFELIEECSKELLNEKERFYIDLYMSKEYGMNTLKGVK